MTSSSQNNPLYNHLVLENVLKYLTFKDLKHVRLTCRFWRQISDPQFIKYAVVYLEGNGLEQFVNSVIRSSAAGNSVHIYPAVTMFENYNIKINSMQSLDVGLRTMWLTIHSSIKILTLHITSFYAMKEMNWMLLHNLPSVSKLKIFVMRYWGPPTEQVTTAEHFEDNGFHPNPNLKFFQISYLGSMSLYGWNEEGSEEFSFPILWDAFFIRFTNLQVFYTTYYLTFLGKWLKDEAYGLQTFQSKHFSLIGLSPLDITKMLEALRAAELPEVTSAMNSLEILDENAFPEAPNDEHLESLCCLNQNFESLHLEISPLASVSLLNNLLTKQAYSLKNLRLRRYPHPYFVEPPTLNIDLQFVTFLEISDSFTPSLSFLSHMPSLQTFHIILRDYRSLPSCEMVQNTPHPARVAHARVKCLYIEPPLISKDCISKLSICFPNLEKLRLRVNDESIQEIYVQASSNITWRNLTSLHVTSWDGLTDEGFTGISQQVLKFWGAYSSFEAKNHRIKPYIGHMAGLQDLTVEMWSDYENHISDWSIYYGILDLENLRELTFIRSDISSTAFKAIPVTNKFLLH